MKSRQLLCCVSQYAKSTQKQNVTALRLFYNYVVKNGEGTIYREWILCCAKVRIGFTTLSVRVSMVILFDNILYVSCKLEAIQPLLTVCIANKFNKQ